MYQIWNNEIFNYFFNSSNKGQEILFNVDKDIIQRIGIENEIDEPLNNFCKSVSEQVLKRDRNNKYKISFENISKDVIQNTPQQTAVIAFFILAASMMKSDNEHSARNYYKRLMALSFNSLDQERDIVPGIIDKQNFKDIFEKFQTYLNDGLNGEKGFIHFRGLNEKEGRKNQDYIGIPILQSMISQKDKCILTEIFDEKLNDEIDISDLQKKGFSTLFNKILSEEKYQGLLFDLIKKLKTNWNGIVEEIYIGQKRRKINVKILYERDGDDVSFYEYFYLREDIRNIRLKEKCFKNWDSMFINDTKLHNFNDYDGLEIESEKDIFFRFPEHHVLLFKICDEKSSYMQTSSINIGDKFSILAPLDTFKNSWRELCFITGLAKDELEEKLIEIDGDNPKKLLLHGVIAKKYSDSFIKIKENSKIICSKGLKVNSVNNTYLSGAGPLIFVNENIAEITLNDEKVTTKGLNERINNPGVYNLKIKDASKEIRITENPSESEFKNVIYHSCYEKHINDTCQNLEKIPYVNGLHLHNFKEEIQLNEKAILRILNIIRSIKRKKSVFYKIDLGIQEFVSDKKIIRALKSLKQDKLFNPAQILYLNKLKHLLGGKVG